MATHDMPLAETAVAYIRSGKQDLFIAVVKSETALSKFEIGDIFIISEDVRRSLKALRRYKSFKEALNAEDVERIHGPKPRGLLLCPNEPILGD